MLKTIVGFMTDPQWVLVIITAVYAAFTIKIFQENRKSSDALKLQIDESARQYEEKKRLEMRPYFNIEIDPLCPNPNGDVQFRLTDGSEFQSEVILFNITNIGLGTAKEIEYGFCTFPEWSDINRKTLGRSALLSGKYYHLKVSFLVAKELIKPSFQKKAFIQIQYEDLLDNKYIAEIALTFVGTDNGFHLRIYDINQGLITDTEKKHA